MARVGVDDQIKKAFQDLIVPGLHTLRRDIRLLGQKVDRVDQKVESLRTVMVSLKGELLAEIRRLDTRIDGVDRQLRTAIDIRERLAALEARRVS
jgi:uncharacterized protein Yka (UPF0111/DUF47 family)